MIVASFNIRHGAPAEKYRGNPEQMAEACKDINADILALQEVDLGVPRSKGKDLAAIAAKRSGMEFVFKETMPFRGGSYGNALLVRGEINKDEVEVLELKGGHRFGVRPEPRNAIFATVYIDGRPISVAATHLSTQRRASRKQLPKIIASLSDQSALEPELPQVLIGDLNRLRRQVIGHVSVNSMILADGDPTYPASNPKKRIDHIAVKGLTIYSVETRLLPISDHRALIAEVE